MTAVVHTLKTGTATTLTTTGGSPANLSAVSAGDFDFRAGGTTNLFEQLLAKLELTCRWATTTGIVAGTIVADAYIVPWDMASAAAVAIDTTAGASYIPLPYRVGSFSAHKGSLATGTDFIFQTAAFELFPEKCSIYILNRSGQTITGNWTLKMLPASAQSN